MPSPPYTDESLGRLVFSQACRDLSDLARAHVATYADGHLRPGLLLEEATRLIDRAEEAVRLAVVAERLRGTSWAEIGEALGVSRQAAHERYAVAEREVREAALFPGRDSDYPGALGWWAGPDGLAYPEETARDLNKWERRHREPTDPDRGEAAVSAGLKPRTTTDEIGTVLTLSKLYLDAHEQHALGGQEQPECLPRGVSYERVERELYERKVAVYERMLADGNPDPEVRTVLAEARARLAEITAAEASR